MTMVSLPIVLASTIISMPVIADDNVRFHGALVIDPCVVSPESIELDFGTTVDKYLYLNTRTNVKPFEISLEECDVSLGKTVSVKFTGTENINLPGLLAIDAANSSAAGIAIGIVDQEGKVIQLNKVSNAHSLSAGFNAISLGAFLQAEPEAIASHSIGRGSFNAVITFSLIYE